MADDDALAILKDIAINPAVPLHMQIGAKETADACPSISKMSKA